jgi:hypothetical protein
MNNTRPNDQERGFEKFYMIFSPSEISIDRDEIFYREKYNEIMNYLKLVLTDSKDLEIYDFIKPEGSLLINIPQGSDVIEFINLISSNYYLNLYRLNFPEISKSPEIFKENFYEILQEITLSKDDVIEKDQDKEKGEEKKNQEEKTKKIILIEQNRKYFKKINGGDLLHSLIENQIYSKEKLDFIDNDTILIWISHDLEEIRKLSNDVFEIFDLFINIPRLEDGERENILRDFVEKHTQIAFDIKSILEHTKNWEIKDIKQLLKFAVLKQFLNADLNITSNEITDVLLETIDNEDYIPSNQFTTSFSQEDSNGEKIEGRVTHKRQDIEEGQQIKKREAVENIVSEIKEEKYSDFMKEQLYENAASKNYNELVLIIDKLEKNESLEENDRKILSNYPFILHESPEKAKINLEKAKKKVDMIKQAFGK